MSATSGMAAGGSIGEFLGTLIGEAIAQGDMEQARNLARTISYRYSNMPLPTILKMYPELMGDTALAGARADDRYTSAEDEALKMMMDRARGGMTAADEANMTRARVAGQQEATAQRQSIDRQMRRRGNSGNAYLAKQVAGQEGANRAYMGGVEAAGAASDRALQSLAMGANYASNLAGRSLDQANRVAGSRDRIQEFNLGRKDRTQLYNNEIGQRQFENAMAREDRASEGLRLLMDQYNARGQSSRRMARAGGGAVGSAVGAIAGGM